ncbi:lactonase family protein [Paraburkholderia sp. C35]|uniref:YncE family protein n=1 Tax=Paraburkholderia sp. C35 TaxID=2126993 RepID=UPI0013A586C4|nr:lactonase family protein [Paraburkholderia sp. C35]
MHVTGNLRRLVLGLTCSLAITSSEAHTLTDASPNLVEDTPIVIDGNPNGVVRYRNGIVFVAVTARAPSAAATAGSAAQIEIFRRTNGAFQRTGTVLLKAGDTVNGLTITPDRTTLVASLESSGVALIDIDEALHGTSKTAFVDQSNGGKIARPGTFQTTVTPDGHYAFVANEYGQLSADYPAGNVGVIALQRNARGLLEGTPLGFIPLAGGTIPGVSVSRDGRRAYAVSEIVPAANLRQLSGTSNTRLTSDQCVQNDPAQPTHNGELSVIDVHKAIEAARVANGTSKIIQGAVITSIAAACSPVRVLESPDGASLWVTARGSDALLQFDTGRLVYDPDGALLQVVNSNGLQPVAEAMFDNGRFLMVTNSARFADTSMGANTARIAGTNVSLFDISRPVATLVQTLPTGSFPRDIAVSPRGRTAFVTNYQSSSVTVLSRGAPSNGKANTVSPFGS